MSNMINTGDICRRIGITVTTEIIIALGFKPDQVDKRAKLWNADKYPAMCEKLGDWIKGKKNVGPVPKPPKKDKTPGSANAAAPAGDDDYDPDLDGPRGPAEDPDAL